MRKVAAARKNIFLQRFSGKKMASKMINQKNKSRPYAIPWTDFPLLNKSNYSGK